MDVGCWVDIDFRNHVIFLFFFLFFFLRRMESRYWRVEN